MDFIIYWIDLPFLRIPFWDTILRLQFNHLPESCTKSNLQNCIFHGKQTPLEFREVVISAAVDVHAS